MNEKLRPQPRPGVMEIAAYVPGKHGDSSKGKVHKLSSNETPLGASPAAIDAAAQVLAHAELYPDGQSSELRAAIAEVHGPNAENILCSNGSDELPGPLAQT